MSIRSVATLVLLVVSIGPTVSTAQHCDDRCADTVRGLLRNPPGFSSSIAEKQTHRLGDQVGSALKRIYSKQALVRPETVRNYLPLVRASFAYRHLITDPAAREPHVTLSLLAWVASRTSDPSTRRELESTITFLRDLEPCTADSTNAPN